MLIEGIEDVVLIYVCANPSVRATAFLEEHPMKGTSATAPIIGFVLPLLLGVLVPERMQAQVAWQIIEPGGETSCAFEDYAFWVREGDPSRVLIHLQGGGACWDRETCDPASSGQRFDARVDAADTVQRSNGMFDAVANENPFRDYTMIFAPYCTGDFHLGARTIEYGDATRAVKVRHAGFANVTAVLRHVEQRSQVPRTIVVSGASAGAVASPVIAAEAARRFPSTEVRQIGDGAAGLRTGVARTLLSHWGADSVLNSLGMPVRETGDVFVGMYLAAARREPRIRFSQVATTEDAVVAAGLERVGEDPGGVGAAVSATFAELREAGICFDAYALAGTTHTLLWRPEFLEVRHGGERLAARLERDVVQRSCERQPAGGAAFLFGYIARPGMSVQFERGYRRHLDWHAEHGDSLPWHAWTVATGPEAGAFIDGTFGITFRAFDERVEPRADAADAAQNVTAFADPIMREVLRLRPDLGGSRALEQGRPSAMQRVLRMDVRAGAVTEFEDALRTLRATSELAVYERLSGGATPSYLVIEQLEAWADLDAPAQAIERVLRVAGPSIVLAESQVWLNRPDLTYLPQRADTPQQNANREARGDGSPAQEREAGRRHPGGARPGSRR